MKHLSLILVLFVVATSATAQEKAAILAGAEPQRVVPTGFYFQGQLNGEWLPAGAYGFGFGTAGKLTVMDLAGKDLMSVNISNDKSVRRPHPLIMAAEPRWWCAAVQRQRLLSHRRQ